MDELIVINQIDHRIITVNNEIAAVTEKDTPHVITIGVEGPAVSSSRGIIQYTAGEALSGHKAVIVSDDNKARYCSCSNLTHVNKLLGITTGASEISSLAEIKTYGELEEPSWNWNTSRPIYAGINGSLIQDIPSSGFIQQVASVITSTKIFININPPIIIN